MAAIIMADCLNERFIMTASASSRRRALLAGASAVGSALLVPGRGAQAAPQAGSGPAPARTAETTEGPYYFDAGKLRRDITEGHEGVPVTVHFTVLNPSGQPWPGARVDIWHCNAQGVYSGYAGQGDGRATGTKGQTFLRGTQLSDAQGVVAFDSIYPGWYHGRTTHIHFKVFNGSQVVLTSQFFLPDTLSEYLYTQLPAYRRASLRDTLNSTDGIAIEAGQTVEGAVRESAGRYLIELTVVADPAARPVPERMPAPPGGEDRPPGPPPEGLGGPGRRGPGGPSGGQALAGDARRDALLPTAARKAAMMPPPPRG